MYENLEILRMAQALAVHSGARQAQIAANVANADTPGYRAVDVKPFAQIYDQRRSGDELRASRPGHIVAGLPARNDVEWLDLAGTADPNGNTVSLETEMIKAVETRHAHETALSVYDTARNILRASLGRGR